VRFQLSCTVNCFAQQFTLKERDIETGLDYFGARYYASMQGRFTGVDPYDINFERQETNDREEAEVLFRDYLFQPQHWNRYVYALLARENVHPENQSFMSRDLDLLGTNFSLEVSNVSVTEVLNRVIRDSQTNYWVVVRQGERKEYFVLNL
jgi:RHS repeat-associated protein